MGKFLDLTGQQFGQWTVQVYVGNKRWQCVCACGTTKSLLSGNLRKGDSLSCGCLALRRIDLTGQRFGRWSVQSYASDSKWHCTCACGRMAKVDTMYLRNGKSRSCGCDTRPLPGARFGHWTLTKLLPRGEYEVICDCGTTDIKKLYCLKIGDPNKSCGCIIRQRNEEYLQLEAPPKPQHSPLLKDLTGSRIGKVVPLEYLGANKWLCRCDCGVTKPMSVSGLRTGRTRSCGCERLETLRARNKAGLRGKYEDISGKQFGRFVVLAPDARASFWKCRCSCGTEKVVQYHNLIRGVSRSCGCLVRDLNAQKRRYESVEAREKVRNDRKRQRRYDDDEYAEHIRRIGRRSSRRQRNTVEGKMRMAQAHTRRRSQCAGPGISAIQWLGLLEAWNNRCAYCEQPGKLTQDHVVALIAGGTHTLDNIVPACHRCNCRKSDIELEIALARLGSRNFHERREAATLLLRDMNHA